MCKWFPFFLPIFILKYLTHDCFLLDDTKIAMTDWAAGEPSNLRGNENRLQLRKAAGYRWNDADGKVKYEQVDGWSVNKYICECEN